MNILDNAVHRHSLRIWRKVARDAPVMDRAGLHAARARAKPLWTALNEVIRTADARLAAQRIDAVPPATPHGTDWSWRPEVWNTPLAAPGMASVRSKSTLGHEVTVFHDCPRSELAVRQARNTRADDRAPYGLQLEVFAFEGSFLSLVLDLPRSAIEGLTRQHLVRLDTIIAVETPVKIFARLNVRHGPNTEQLVRELPLDAAETTVEFDLAYSKLDDRRLGHAWIDLILDTPHMSHVAVHDVTLSRRLRAAL